MNVLQCSRLLNEVSKLCGADNFEVNNIYCDVQSVSFVVKHGEFFSWPKEIQEFVMKNRSKVFSFVLGAYPEAPMTLSLSVSNVYFGNEYRSRRNDNDSLTEFVLRLRDHKESIQAHIGHS